MSIPKTNQSGIYLCIPLLLRCSVFQSRNISWYFSFSHAVKCLHIWTRPLQAFQLLASIYWLMCGLHSSSSIHYCQEEIGGDVLRILPWQIQICLALMLRWRKLFAVPIYFPRTPFNRILGTRNPRYRTYLWLKWLIEDITRITMRCCDRSPMTLIVSHCSLITWQRR